jgi:hypothetical protein
VLRTHALCQISTSRIQTERAAKNPHFAEFAEVEPMLWSFEAFTAQILGPLPRVQVSSPWMLAHAPALLATGIVERMTEDMREVGHLITCKWFGIEKSDTPPTFRLLANKRPLNAAMRKALPMGLPKLHRIIRRLLRAHHFGMVDARSYFFQFGIGANIRNFFAARFSGSGGHFELFRSLVLIMGWKWAPCIAQRFSNGLCSAAELRCGWVLPWLDNFVFGAQSKLDCEDSMERFMSVCKEFNVDIKEAGTELKATQHGDVLGMHFNLQQGSVSDSFVSKALTAIDAITEFTTPRQFYQALGSLIWRNFAVGRSPLAQFPQLLKAARDIGSDITLKKATWDSLFTASPELLRELRFMRVQLNTNEPLFARDLDATPSGLAAWSDASDRAFGIVIEKNGADVFSSGGTFGLKAHFHIYFKELLAAVWAAEAVARHLGDRPPTSPMSVLFLIDNMAVVGSLSRGHGHSTESDHLILRFYRALPSCVRPAIFWVPTGIQRADALSRAKAWAGPKVDLTGFAMEEILTKFLRG